MADLLTSDILQKIDHARELYHRLILLVGPANSGKTMALQKVAALTSAPLININLELSRRLLDLTEHQRSLETSRIMGELVSEVTGDLALLDNLEIVLDAHLKLDPLRLLQQLSRNKTIVAAWNGSIVNNHLTYATPSHPEYRRYAIQDLIIVCPPSLQTQPSDVQP